ncbi:pentatricopeptide repeat-containing protein At1g62930, chloroplastic-like [Telopea speciosissima]|uniref:pentatricopeptide repeat-containing protein At1g62930, chloroplastic-like n=1 Tax=Telopea speciosissima TaxID=54955 RepID=UPI001CC6480B|nr:pentatricopeptide repeat-containing protein At1g62930, chloroplastic-like [Telopea speciosissima]
MSWGYEPNTISYSSLINGYCKCKRMNEAFQLFKEMPHKGIIVDTITYTSLIQGFFLAGQVGYALKVFKEIKVHGHNPNQHTYSILMSGLCKSRRVDDALKLFHGIDSKNLDILTYSVLLDRMWESCMPKEAEEFFNSITSKGLEPDIMTYGTMIKGLCKEGLLSKAWDLFMKLKEKGCPPNNVTYNILVQGFLQKKETNKAFELLNEMSQRSFLPDAKTASLIVDLLAYGGSESECVLGDDQNATCAKKFITVVRLDVNDLFQYDAFSFGSSNGICFGKPGVFFCSSIFAASIEFMLGPVKFQKFSVQNLKSYLIIQFDWRKLENVVRRNKSSRWGGGSGGRSGGMEKFEGLETESEMCS